MASEKTIDKLNAALFQIDDLVVSPEVAAAMFGIKKRYFNRLVAANNFGLQNCQYHDPMFATVMYFREDIERISHVYKSQKKRR